MGPESDPLVASALSYSSPAALYDPYAPWAVSSLSHSASDGLSWAFSYSYDSSYLFMSSASEGPSGALPADLIATSWSYDGLGNPTSVSQSSNAYASMAYSDQHGTRLLSSLSYGVGSFSWSYDAFGRPVSISYAEPNQTPSVLGAYSYDEFGRLTQALGESYSWNDDGTLTSLSCGSLAVSYSRFDAHSSESVSFNNENPTIVSSHGPEACSYGDPRLGEALFQLIPGLSSAVFPEPENAGSTPWDGSVAHLTLRGRSMAIGSRAGWIPSFSREGAATCLRLFGTSYYVARPRYAFPVQSPPAGGAPGASAGFWVKLSSPLDGKPVLQASVGAAFDQNMENGHADHAVLLRLKENSNGSWSLEAVAQHRASPQAEGVAFEAPITMGSWHFLCLSLSYGGDGSALDSISLRVDGARYSSAPPSGFPAVQWPSSGSLIEVSFLGGGYAPAYRPWPDHCDLTQGLAYAPFISVEGSPLSSEEELFAYQETKKAVLGDPSSMGSPVAARSFLSPDIPSGFEAIAPLEGDFSLIAGTLGPSEVSAPSGRLARPGDAFRYDPVERRFRYWPCGDALVWAASPVAAHACFAFCFRPAGLEGAAPLYRTLCRLGFGGRQLGRIVLMGSDLYLVSGASYIFIGDAGPSTSQWLGVELWTESRDIGFLKRTVGVARVYLGDSSFSYVQSDLIPSSFLLSVSGDPFIDLGGEASAPFLGFADRFGAWIGDWSSQKMSALQSCFSAQKVSVEEIDPFGQLSSRSMHGPSGLLMSSSFAPLIVQEGAESLRRPGLVSSEGHAINGAPASSFGREYEYDYFGRLVESFAVGADHEEDDPLDSYEYDGLGRLKSWTDPNGKTTEYTWADGHVTKVKKDPLTSTFSYSGHRMTSAPGMMFFSYRADAPFLINKISMPQGHFPSPLSATLSYMGRTITGVSVQGSFPMTPCSFSYDARGRRTSKTSNGITHSYFYEGSTLIRESISDSPSHDLRFFYHMSGAPAFMTLDGVAYYYVVDAFGSVVGLVDGSGSLVATYSYDPWGKILSTTDTSGVGLVNLNPLRYRSYYYDSETRWYLCGSRYYSPEWMRWVTPDSVDYLDPETPGGLDPYAYCYGDPVDYADPTGTEAIALSIAAVMLIIGAVGLLSLAATESQTHLLTNFSEMLAAGIGDAVETLVDWISTWDFSWLGDLMSSFRTDSSTLTGYYPYPLLNIGPSVMYSKSWDPNARPGQKKQGRERKNKARARFTKKCKYRNGPKPLKHHTPGHDHKKYLWWLLFGFWRDGLYEDDDDEGFF